MVSWWRDIVSAALVVFGGVVMFAKLQSYDWWLIGSWKGALGVLAATGGLLLLVNLQQLINFDTLTNLFEILLWTSTIAYFVTALVITTTKLQFIIGGALLAAIWLVQFTENVWVHTTHPTNPRYASSH